MTFKLSRQQLQLLTVGIIAALLLVGAISWKAYGLSADMSPREMRDAITATVDYQAILFVNLLIGFSTLLMIMQLRGDALRVLLTVGVALIFGYLMTMLFNLDASVVFSRGEFRVSLLSDAVPLTSINYGDELTVELNDPRAETPITEVTHHFTGTAGDVVSVLAFGAERRSKLNMQLTLLDNAGNVLQENLDADDAQKRTFRRYLQSDGDAVVEGFVLPATGFYTIIAKPEADTADVNAEFTLALLSDNAPPVTLAYGSDPVGGIFNKEKTDAPLTTATYKFSGGKGDMVTILAYAFRGETDLDLQVTLKDANGEVLAANNDASAEQVESYRPQLKSTQDAIIQNVILPADGIYTITARPEPLSSSAQLRETVRATNKAYDAFLFGPLSRLNRWVIWIRDALTLIMLGLAVAIVFRAEQFSLGSEGQLYFGALVSAIIGLYFGNVPKTILVPMALLSAATAGFLWGLLPGALKAYLGANELVSTLMLNTIATRFYEMVLTFQLKPPDAGYTSSEWIPNNGLLAPIIDVNGDQITIAVFILIALVLLAWVMIQRTPIGYEIRMIGANIKFANYGGVNTRRTIMLTMAISGAIAGLAGAHLAMGIHRKLILNISVGLAFEGVVVALLARNNPLVVPFTGLLYAYLRTGAQMMERDANISAEVVRIIQAVVILLITAEALVSLFQQRRMKQRDKLMSSQGDTPAPAEGGA
ncbi:MAG: ABC transporter permease [Chloroflexi bacterium]|nr:ABC transporter permease [Chloroflexota bacterium]